MTHDTPWFRMSAALDATLCDEEPSPNTLAVHSSSKGRLTDLVRYPATPPTALILSKAAAELFAGFRLPVHETHPCLLQLRNPPGSPYVFHDMQPTKLDLRLVDYGQSRFFSVTARGVRRYHDLHSAEDHERLVAEITRLNAQRTVLEREKLDCERITFLPAASPALDLFIALDWDLSFHVRRGLKDSIESAGFTGFSFGPRSRLYLC